jgi:hypothetical protein
MKEKDNMKIAIATTDGKIVDQHFGRAQKFSIYEKSDSGLKLLEERKTISYCKCSDCGPHEFFADRLEEVSSKIKDCQVIVACQIGKVPSEKLYEKGFQVISYEGEISHIPFCNYSDYFFKKEFEKMI